MKMPALEDNFRDVIAKAQVGRGLPEALRVPDDEMPDDAALREIAAILGLNAGALIALAHEKIVPPTPASFNGFAMFTTNYRDGITVNNYLVWSPATKEAALFDTGTEIENMLAFTREKHLSLKTLFLTHAHPDHIAATDRILAAFPDIRIRIDAREPTPFPDAKIFTAGTRFDLGDLTIEAKDAAGHSPGQTAFFATGLTCPLAVVGDSIFAGSMGRSADFFEQQRANVRDNILTLPAETVLAPGHGPLTTVGFEKQNNPFFAGA